MELDGEIPEEEPKMIDNFFQIEDEQAWGAGWRSAGGGRAGRAQCNQLQQAGRRLAPGKDQVTLSFKYTERNLEAWVRSDM